MLVGRTEPELDPKGVLTVEAIDNAAAKLHDPRLKSALNSFPVYPETALVGRLQSGQLDAGFFYSAEAATAHIPTVSLKPVFKYALYTVTILNRDPDPAGAAALVRYLLSSTRHYTLKHSGFEPLRPKFSGHAGGVPKSLRAAVGAG
jgi:molybdate/tungstate transport system substrate-binding protein